MKVYLDYAASTPLDEQVKRAMDPYLSEQFFHPSALYSSAKNVKLALETARQKIAENIGIKKSELVFTAGATEANNLAVFGVARNNPEGHIIVSAIEHDSILKPVQYLASQGIEVTFINPDNQGIISVESVLSAIQENTVLVSVIMANNEIGSIQPISKISDSLNIVRKDRAKAGNKSPLVFHTDAAQTANYLDIKPKRLGVDLLTFNGSKIYGPKQIGALYVGSEVELVPLIFGGGQERGLRSGTENIAYIHGFAEALSITLGIRKSEAERLRGLQKYFINSILDNFSQAKLNGSMKRRLPNNVHITFEGIDNERLLYQLDELGVFAASGSACSEAADEPSHVLKAIGLKENQIRSSIRFSMGRQTTKADIDYALDCLSKLITQTK